MAVQVARRRFTVDEYHQMARAGILSEDDRVELLDGEIVETSPIGSLHQACVDRLTWLFTTPPQIAAIVRVQGPVQLDLYSEPQPDLLLLRPRDDFYARTHPGPEDVLLVVEVADRTVEYDRRMKLPYYAWAGLPEAWLVDLPGSAVDVYRGPSPQGYTDTPTRSASRAGSA
jgi:Uma2 family endonuclease